MHLLGDDDVPADAPAPRPASVPTDGPAASPDDDLAAMLASTAPEALFERLDELTARVTDLEAQLARLNPDDVADEDKA